MAGLLDGGLANIIGRAFSTGYQKFMPAVRLREAYDQDGSGDLIDTTPVQKNCLGFVGPATERMQGQDGFTVGDVALYVLGTSLNPVQGQPSDLTTDDEVRIDGGVYAGTTFSIQSVDLDPAGALFTCRARAPGVAPSG